jgi:hypothetical protein
MPVPFLMREMILDVTIQAIAMRLPRLVPLRAVERKSPRFFRRRGTVLTGL